MGQTWKIDASTKEVQQLTAMLKRWGMIDDDKVAVPDTGVEYVNKSSDSRRNILIQVLPEDLYLP